MPIYKYKCDSCGYESEELRPIDGQAEVNGCPICSAGNMQPAITMCAHTPRKWGDSCNGNSCSCK